jgi:hypothetical protein
MIEVKLATIGARLSGSGEIVQMTDMRELRARAKALGFRVHKHRDGYKAIAGDRARAVPNPQNSHFEA